MLKLVIVMLPNLFITKIFRLCVLFFEGFSPIAGPSSNLLQSRMHQLVVAGWLADAPYVAASGNLPLCCPGHMGSGGTGAGRRTGFLTKLVGSHVPLHVFYFLAAHSSISVCFSGGGSHFLFFFFLLLWIAAVLP